MFKVSWLSLAAIGFVVVLAGCGGSKHTQVRTEPSPPPAAVAARAEARPVPTAPAVDPVQALITESQQRYLKGQRELELGHLDRARAEFNAALDVLLNAPGGARTEPRLREQFDRLVDKISSLEVAALATGDGFAEKPAEPASIDELLELSATFDEPSPTAAVTAAVQTDLAQTSHDIPIPMNQRVLGYVELFQTRLRSYLQDGLQRGSQYLPMIQSVFRAEGLPLDLAYVPLIESAFKTNALSRKSAKGVWQFMRPTALENGLRHDWYIDERSDPDKATRAAAKYLKTLSRIFDGDWHLALASYNGGPGRVQRAMKRTGRTNFWQLSSLKRGLPRETRDYVPMILAAMIIARNPAQYGFELILPDRTSRETITVNGPVDLRRVAEWTGMPVDVIQQLNPELRRWTTPVRGSRYELKVPEGTADLLRARLEESGDLSRASLHWHTVKSGETLKTIARKLRVSRIDLAEANYMTVRSRVRPGEKLIVPRAPTTLMAAQPERPTPALKTRPLATRASLISAGGASATEGDQPEPERRTYRVKRGDTLSSIARLFSTSVSALKQWNRLRSNRISPGQRLTVYTSSS
jgi:membrane-bound lytic murein transglycosylase D